MCCFLFVFFFLNFILVCFGFFFSWFQFCLFVTQEITVLVTRFQFRILNHFSKALRVIGDLGNITSKERFNEVIALKKKNYEQKL